jgi:L-seryl-tRNA(Ser) seleniumtransferase
MSDFRSLPSVDSILQSPAAQGWIAAFGRPLTLGAVRTALAQARQQITLGAASPAEAEIYQRTESLLNEQTRFTLTPVINASGVILHTNLGRAPLSRAALQAVNAVSLGYSNLEFDLPSGKRCCNG